MLIGELDDGPNHSVQLRAYSLTVHDMSEDTQANFV